MVHKLNITSYPQDRTPQAISGEKLVVEVVQVMSFIYFLHFLNFDVIYVKRVQSWWVN